MHNFLMTALQKDPWVHFTNNTNELVTWDNKVFLATTGMTFLHNSTVFKSILHDIYFTPS